MMIEEKHAYASFGIDEDEYVIAMREEKGLYRFIVKSIKNKAIVLLCNFPIQKTLQEQEELVPTS